MHPRQQDVTCQHDSRAGESCLAASVTSSGATGDTAITHTLVGSPVLMTVGLEAILSPAMRHTASSPPRQPATAVVPSLQERIVNSALSACG